MEDQSIEEYGSEDPMSELVVREDNGFLQNEEQRESNPAHISKVLKTIKAYRFVPLSSPCSKCNISEMRLFKVR